jgi:hypothetical protein
MKKLKTVGKWASILVVGYIIFNIFCHFHCLSMM